MRGGDYGLQTGDLLVWGGGHSTELVLTAHSEWEEDQEQWCHHVTLLDQRGLHLTCSFMDLELQCAEERGDLRILEREDD